MGRRPLGRTRCRREDNTEMDFMVTPCINNAEPFFYSHLMHIMLKNTELLKHSKLDKNAPTCFSLHRNHLQGAKVSAWLKNYTFG